MMLAHAAAIFRPAAGRRRKSQGSVVLMTVARAGGRRLKSSRPVASELLERLQMQT